MHIRTGVQMDKCTEAHLHMSNCASGQMHMSKWTGAQESRCPSVHLHIWTPREGSAICGIGGDDPLRVGQQATHRFQPGGILREPLRFSLWTVTHRLSDGVPDLLIELP